MAMNEENRKKSIYKNVFAFPQGTDHLKYFEKNPHPDKIPDEELAISELFSQPDLNNNYLQKKRDFEAVKNYLEPHLSETDREILRLPDKMQAMIDTAVDEDYIKAFTHLRDAFLNYFSTPTDSSTPSPLLWIDYYFAKSNYSVSYFCLQYVEILG